MEKELNYNMGTIVAEIEMSIGVVLDLGVDHTDDLAVEVALEVEEIHVQDQTHENDHDQIENLGIKDHDHEAIQENETDHDQETNPKVDQEVDHVAVIRNQDLDPDPDRIPDKSKLVDILKCEKKRCPSYSINENIFYFFVPYLYGLIWLIGN